MITKIKFENFTAFDELAVSFSPGINILLGENGTGKTHVMKALYAACSVIDMQASQTYDQKLRSVFLPNSIGRLVHRSQGRNSGAVKVYRNDGSEPTDRSMDANKRGTSRCYGDSYARRLLYEAREELYP